MFLLCFIAEHRRLDSLHYAFSAQCRPLQVPLNAAAFVGVVEVGVHSRTYHH